MRKKKTINKKGVKRRPPKKSKPKAAKSKYIKVLSTESRARFAEMSEMINNKKLKWAYYCVENQVGIHYYLILKGDKNEP